MGLTDAAASPAGRTRAGAGGRWMELTISSERHEGGDDPDGEPHDRER